jgi:hypothetical protein
LQGSKTSVKFQQPIKDFATYFPQNNAMPAVISGYADVQLYFIT